MKKAISVLILLILFVSLFGCNQKKEIDPVKNQVSFYHSSLYCGQNESFSVTIESGKKEKDLIIDGRVGAMTDFTKIRVTPLNADNFGKDYSYELIGKNGKLNGKLENDLTVSAYIKDIENISSLGVITGITIKAADIDSKITLTDKINDMLKWQDVLDIAKENYSQAISNELQENNFNREIFIKFVNDNKNTESPYYWYIAMIASKNDYWAMLIEPKSGTIITKKS